MMVEPSYTEIRKLNENTYVLFISNKEFSTRTFYAVVTIDRRMLRFTFADNTDIFVANTLDDMDIENAITSIYSIIFFTPNKTFDNMFNYYNSLDIVLVSANAAMTEGYEYRNPDMIASLEEDRLFEVVDILFVGRTIEDVVPEVNRMLILKEELTDMKISF